MRYDPDYDTSTNDTKYDDTLTRANSIIKSELNNINCEIKILPFGTIFITINIKETRFSILEQGIINPSDKSELILIKLDRVSSFRYKNQNYPKGIMHEDTRWTFNKLKNTLYIAKFD